MVIPLEEGFTVVTGPNGSGKSNILDGVLFCLGLATSRGMRADRLPDLVNSRVLRDGKSAETVVSVRFDLSDWSPDPAEEGLDQPSDGPWIKTGQKEWTVTRKLRVMPGGSYSSSYAADGEVCNLQQLQTQLRRLRIDPEGSNVVMQGDVTRIVSMSNKDRRGLIDELAGVALFDNRIEQTRSKLDDVHDRQERCRIVEQELVTAKHRLERDCAKARQYQELKEQLGIAKQQELVLGYEDAEATLRHLNLKKQNLELKEVEDLKKLQNNEKKLSLAIEQLHQLQQNVKSLGEDKLIAVQAEIAGLDTQARELDRQAAQHKTDGEKLQEERQELVERRNKINAEKVKQLDQSDHSQLEEADKACKEAESAVEVSRRRLGEVAGRSGAWWDDYQDRRASRTDLELKLKPLQDESQKLEERLFQIGSREKELQVDLEREKTENNQVHLKIDQLDNEWKTLLDSITSQKKHIQQIADELSIQQRTRVRLEQEQSRFEKDIARLESRKETLQESRGTGALRVLLEGGLEGIHGPVAQLGEVDEVNRLALEVAAGARLGHVVVDNDQIAAKAIDLLKKRQAGRLTFLPLNKIKPTGPLTSQALQRGKNMVDVDNKNGLIGRAIDLVKFDPIYKEVFSYVFGETLVFSDLNSARIQLGKKRAVTTQGELLERSGAMTGGSISGRGFGITFGTNKEIDELEPIRQRLLEIGETLVKCNREESVYNKNLEEARPALRKLEQRQAALEAERRAVDSSNLPFQERSQEIDDRLQVLLDSKKEYNQRLNSISNEIDLFKKQLIELDIKEKDLQIDKNSQDWKQLESDLEAADQVLVNSRSRRDHILNEQRQNELNIDRLEDQLQSLLGEESRLQMAVKTLADSHKNWRDHQKELQSKRKNLELKEKELQNSFGEQRRARDSAEADVANQRQSLQEDKWKLERLRGDLTSLAEEIRSGAILLRELEESLPDPLPVIPESIRNSGLAAIKDHLNKLQKSMEDLEPVNMLALEELEKLETRLLDLGSKLETLSNERSELLLRIETVGTLRQEAFMEAFEAVDKYFGEIFASLSEGDGHLQLENPQSPLDGGLTLVAHPKGKTVRRLASMSGGEKSLTALSFLFALQRFRPSPFYALDEVDSFLDGVNVERLSSLIASQAEQAQFLVVSHRRPMIGASTRTIGVTQARGAHTQVVGLPDAA